MSSAAIILFATLVALLLSALHRRAARFPLPPGPRGTFIAGAADKLPRTEPWKTYASWHTIHPGALLSFRVHTRTTVILPTHDTIRALLDARAPRYAARPWSPMYDGLCARANAVFNARGVRHAAYRRLLGDALAPAAERAAHPLLEDEAAALLAALADTPSEYGSHLRHHAVAVVLRLAYGYRAVPSADPLVRAAEEAAAITRQALTPGRWLVDYYPLLRFIPRWAPGAHFRRQAEVWRVQLAALSAVPHAWVEKQMAAGTHEDSFTARLLSRPDGPAPDIIAWCAAGLYAGGTDTIAAALTSFVLLMAAFPNVQSIAQHELGGRVPTAADLPRMAYLSALFKEILRFAPVAPLTLPHSTDVDDTYAGLRIPAGASVVPNIWAALRDPAAYPDPETFDPARFLGPAPQRDPRGLAFGAGARRCPGARFAETWLLLAMGAVLARCKIEAEGAAPTELSFTTGITSHVAPFPIRIKHRDTEAEA